MVKVHGSLHEWRKKDSQWKIPRVCSHVQLSRIGRLTREQEKFI